MMFKFKLSTTHTHKLTQSTRKSVGTIVFLSLISVAMLTELGLASYRVAQVSNAISLENTSLKGAPLSVPSTSTSYFLSTILYYKYHAPFAFRFPFPR